MITICDKGKNINLNKPDIILIVYLFLWFFDPPIFYDFSFEPVLAIYSIIYILLNYKYATKAMIKSRITVFIKSYYVFFTYAIFIIGLNIIIRNDSNLYYSYFSVFLSLISYIVYILSIAL